MRLVAVMVGGAAGALVRWRVGLALPAAGGLPLATFVVNTSGAFGLGLLGVLLLLERLPRTRYLHPLLGTGFLDLHVPDAAPRGGRRVGAGGAEPAALRAALLRGGGRRLLGGALSPPVRTPAGAGASGAASGGR